MRHLQVELERLRKDCKNHLDADTLEAMNVAFETLDMTCYQQSLASQPTIDAPVESLLVLASKKIPVESEVDENSLREIHEIVENLREAIGKLESEQLSLEFEKILAIADESLEYYAVNGAEGLEEAVHRMMARMYKLHESPMKEQVENTSAWSTSKTLVLTLDKAVSVALKAKAITEAAAEYLPWLLG